MNNIKWKLYNYQDLENDYIITMLKNGFYYELDDDFNTKIDNSVFNDIIKDIKNNIYENILTEEDIFL